MSAILVRPLCPELELIAELELHETPKKLEEGIKHLKDWLKKQPHLRARADDQWLAAFLRGCKHSLEAAKEKLDIFYTLRSVAPELYALKYWQPKFKELLQIGYSLILPKRLSPGDPRVVIIRVGNFDITKFAVSEVFAVSAVVHLISHMEDDPLTVAGVTLIFDLTDLTMSHFAEASPAIIKKAVTYCQDASPLRLKKCHIIGMPPYFQPVFRMATRLLKEKNKQKVLLHGTFEELYEHVSKDILPVEYGGNGCTVQEIIDYWNKKVKEYESFLDEELQFGTDEDKRPGRPRSAESMFGIDGSFRQLDFD